MAELRSRKIGKYQIQAELGRGGFGSVYRAYDPTVGRLVAIKVLTASGDQQLLTRFKNEAGAAGNLRHNNIVTIYEFGEHEGLPYIVMEFLEGEDLQEIISKKKPLTLLQKVSIMLQVADGLQCAHRSGVVHRDVKPGNIRLLPDGTVKIMDFGVARLLTGGGAGARLTRQGHVIGTLLYMAPEQVRGGEVDFLCDIFAYGITYYELLTGKHPFQGSDPRTVFYRITTEDPEPLRNMVPDCPEALQAILSRTLHKERELRYQSLREVQLDTEPLLIELRQERAAALLAEANSLYGGGQLDGAQAVLNEAFDLDPGNRGARQLRETIQNQLLRRVIEPKIEALLKKGEDAIAKRQFEEAIESLEAALRLDRDNSEIKERVNRARGLLELSRESARRVADARREFTRNNLEASLQGLQETLELDPGNPDVRLLFQEVREELARREKEREYEKKLQQAKDLLQANRFDDALRQLANLDADDQARDDIRKLTAQISDRKQADKRRQKFREELTIARELLDASQYDAAIPRIERLMNEHPEEAEATRLFILAHKKLAAQHKVETLEKLRIEIGGLLEGRQYERALELVNDALRDYPSEQHLLDTIHDIEAQQQKYRKSEAVREAVEAAESSIAQGAPEAAVHTLEAAIARFPNEERLGAALSDARLLAGKKRRDEAVKALCRDADLLVERSEFDQALGEVENGIRAYGREPMLTAARDRVRDAKEQWERAESIRQALQGSEQRLARNEPEQAVQAIEAALGRYPGEEQLSEALSLARKALQAKHREEAIVAISRDAESQLANGDFQRALDGVEQGLERFGHDDRLVVLRENALHAKAERERKQAVQGAREDARQLLARNEPAGAVAILEAALTQYADEAQLKEALSQAHEALEAKRREAGIDQVCLQVGSQLEQLAFDEALAGVATGVGTFGDDARFARLRDKILAAKADWERSETVRDAVEKAQQLQANDNPEGSIDVLEAALSQYPREELLKNAVSQARRALEAKRRENAIEAAAREAGSLLESQHFDQALAVIAQTVEVHGPDERLGKLRDRVDRAEAAWRRSEQVRKAIEDSDQQLANGEPASAVALLESALRQYPDDERLSEALAGARKTLDAVRREAAIEELCREATAQLERREFDRALDGIEQGLKNFGEDGRLASLKEKIVSTRTEWHRAEVIRRALQESRQRLAQHDPESAVQILEAALVRCPDEPQLADAISAAREAFEAKQREDAIESVCRKAGADAERLDFSRALAGIAQAIQMYGSQERLTQLRDSILAAQAAWEHEQAVARALEDSSRLLSQDNPESAVEALEAALGHYPDDQRLVEAASAAAQAVDRKRRNAAIDAICQAAAGKTEAQEFDAALEQIARGIEAHGAEERLLAAQRKTVAAKADFERRENLRTALEEYEHRLGAGEPESALHALEAALQQYPDDAQLLAAVSRAQQAVEAKRRRAAIQDLDRQVRQFLKNRQFQRALAAIERELSAYPGEQKLTELHDEVAAAAAEWEREQNIRKALSRGAELHGKNRLADALRALKEALDQYPAEPRLVTACQEIEADFQRHQREEALRAALEEAKRLMALETPAEAVQLLEALLQEHPDDARVIEALNSARELLETKRREESINALCRETRLFLQSREFIPAQETIERALQTFGDEKRLTQMRETVLASKADWDRAESVREVVEKAGRYVAQGQFEAAIESLESATRTYGPDDRLTEALSTANAAIEKKRRQDAISKVCKKVRAELEAQRLDQAAQMLDRGEQSHGAAPEFASLRERITAAKADRERAEQVGKTSKEANRLIGEGAFEQAVRLIEAALTRYPEERELLEIRANALQALERKRKEDAIEAACIEIRALQNQNEFKGALKKIAEAEKRHGAGRHFEQLRTEVISARKAWDDRRRAEKGNLVRNPWLIRAAAAIVIVAAVAVVGALVRDRFAVKTVHLQVRPTPANATVRIENQTCANGDCGFDLKPGEYSIQVSADGYQTKTERARLALGDPSPTLRITIPPLPPSIQITANFTQGQVVLDGSARGRLQEGQFVVDGLQPGKHELEISGSDGGTVLPFESEFAKLPVLGNISADGVDAIALGSFGNQVAVSCSGCSGTVTVDERPAGEIKDGKITIGSLSAGTHQLRLNSQSGERSIVFALGGVPTINLAVTSNRNYGMLVIETGEDGASVFVDGQRYPKLTERGQLRLPVEAKEHTVRVAKDAYKVEPAEFRGAVTKGGQLRARFRLTAEPVRLLVTEGVPGASVSIDGRTVGTVAANGSFSAQVSPGEHQLAFSREGYTSAYVRRDFVAGRAVVLGREEVQMAVVAAPPKIPPKVPPKAPPVEIARPDPAAAELAEWQRVSRNPTVGDMEEFLQKHPGGNNAQEARRILERLEWDATNKSNRTAVQAYLTKHPNGAFATQASAELTRIDREAAAELQKQREAERIRSDREQVRTILRGYGEAYARKDINQVSALWPSAPANTLRQIREAFRDFRSLKLELRPLAEPEISGTSARVTCTRLVVAVDRNGSHPNQDTVTVTFEKRSGAWLIDSIQ